jgi:hypothetical protein
VQIYTKKLFSGSPNGYKYASYVAQTVAQIVCSNEI